MSLAHLLLRHARLSRERPAIHFGIDVWATNGQWAERSAGLAARLRDAGLTPGDRVLLFMRNHPRYLELFWGAWWAGLVVVPVNAKLHAKEAEWIIENAQIPWGFVTRDVAAATAPVIATLSHQPWTDPSAWRHSSSSGIQTVSNPIASARRASSRISTQRGVEPSVHASSIGSTRPSSMDRTEPPCLVG